MLVNISHLTGALYALWERYLFCYSAPHPARSPSNRRSHHADGSGHPSLFLTPDGRHAGEIAFGVLLVFSLVIGLGMVSQALAQDKMESYSGKVTAVDPGGEAIVIDVGTGKNALVVGAIVTPDTVLMVKGKKMPIADLAKEVKAGDMVTLKIERTTDLYAKEISKK